MPGQAGCARKHASTRGQAGRVLQSPGKGMGDLPGSFSMQPQAEHLRAILQSTRQPATLEEEQTSLSATRLL